MREDLRPAYLPPSPPDKFPTDETPREGSYFLFLPRQSIHTNGLVALEKKPPRYAYTKGGVPLVKVYSGATAAPKLTMEGRPKVQRLGLPNALVAGGGVLAILGAVAVKRRRERGEE